MLQSKDTVAIWIKIPLYTTYKRHMSESRKQTMKVRKGKEIIQANENGKKTGVETLL